MTTQEVISGPVFTMALFLGGIWAGAKTKAAAASKTLIESQRRLIETRDLELGDLRREMAEVREENKGLMRQVAEHQQQIAKLEARPDYAGIQGHIDAMEARNIARHEALLAQLTAMTVQISRMGDQTTRTARTRKGDAAVASQDKTIGGRG